MKRPAALLALFLVIPAAFARPTVEEAAQAVKLYNKDQLCRALYTVDPMYRETLANEVASRKTSCAGYLESMQIERQQAIDEERERRQDAWQRQMRQQAEMNNTLQIMQMLQPQPMPNLIQPQSHCVTRYAAGQWYTDCR